MDRNEFNHLYKQLHPEFNPIGFNLRAVACKLQKIGMCEYTYDSARIHVFLTPKTDYEELLIGRMWNDESWNMVDSDGEIRRS